MPYMAIAKARLGMCVLLLLCIGWAGRWCNVRMCKANRIFSEQLRCRAFSASNKAWTGRTKTPPTHRNPTSICTSICLQTPLPDISGQFGTGNVTNRHQQLSQHILRLPKRRFRRCDISSWYWMSLAVVCWCLIMFCVVLRRTEDIWRASECRLWTCVWFWPIWCMQCGRKDNWDFSNPVVKQIPNN